MKENFEDGEIIQGKFKNVPIERPKNNDDEIYYMHSNIHSGFSYLKYRIKKICKYSFLFILIFAFIIFTKRMLLDGIFEYFNREKEYTYFASNNTNNKRPDNYTFDESVFEFDEVEKYYIHQNNSNISMESLISPQLKNPNNIKLVDTLVATLDLEYDKFVHLQIKDADKKRFEIPKKEILSQDYLYSLNDSRIPLSIYANYLEAQNFFIEFLTNKFGEYEIEHFREIHMSEDEEFQNIESFAFRIMDTRENQLFRFNSTNNFIFSENYINFQYELTSDNIFGFGECNHDFKISNGLYTIYQQNHFPIAIHKTAYENIWLGFVFLNTNAQDVKIYKKNKKKVNIEHKTIGGIIDYYIIVDESPEEILKDLQFLLGTPTLPPFWSLGNHLNKYGYKNLEEFRSIYEQNKKYEIPFDSMWVKIDDMENMENNKLNNISSYIKEEIHKDGGKIVTSINYGLSYENQNSPLIKLGNLLDIFVKSNYTKKPLISRTSSGKIIYPDFMNPKISEFWSKVLDILLNITNFDGIFLDINEPINLLKKDKKCFNEIADQKNCTKDKNIYDINNLSYLPGYNDKEKDYTLSKNNINENTLIRDNLTIFDTRPLISYFGGKTTYDYLNNNLTMRPFILSGSSTIGSGKYNFHLFENNYNGEYNINNSISNIFNFNIFGIPFTGTDINCFNNDTNKTLCIRRYNLEVFYPFIKNNIINETNINNYDEIKIIKNGINFRYSILRYMYSQIFLTSLNEKGSFFKPLMFEFPEDKSSYEDIESKIMLGDAFLICAFYDMDETDKEFSFPKEGFNKYPSGKLIKNKKDKKTNITLSGKFDEIHILLRQGFIIPRQNTFDKYILNTMKLREENLDLIINIDKSKKSKGVIFFDNDEINVINNERYFRVDLSFTENKLYVNTNKNKLRKYKYNVFNIK